MLLKRFLSYTDALEHIERNEALFRLLYVKQNLTARKVAESQNTHYDANFQKALFRTFGPKGMGHGGARVGSGQKKKKPPQ